MVPTVFSAIKQPDKTKQKQLSDMKPPAPFLEDVGKHWVNLGTFSILWADNGLGIWLEHIKVQERECCKDIAQLQSLQSLSTGSVHCRWLFQLHPVPLASGICLIISSLSACSVAVVTLNDPSLVNVVLLASKVAVTPHSFSRFCFRSRHAANAQPTAWLNLSPCTRQHCITVTEQKHTCASSITNWNLPLQNKLIKALKKTILIVFQP